MSRQPLQLAVILGSVREGRFGPTVGNWFAGQARLRSDVTVDVIDLVTVDLPMTQPAFDAEPVPAAVNALRDLTPRLTAADAFVVVTPEYNHSFPAQVCDKAAAAMLDQLTWWARALHDAKVSSPYVA